MYYEIEAQTQIWTSEIAPHAKIKPFRIKLSKAEFVPRDSYAIQRAAVGGWPPKGVNFGTLPRQCTRQSSPEEASGAGDKNAHPVSLPQPADQSSLAGRRMRRLYESEAFATPRENTFQRAHSNLVPTW
jgi:hypothetical protein